MLSIDVVKFFNAIFNKSTAATSEAIVSPKIWAALVEAIISGVNNCLNVVPPVTSDFIFPTPFKI